MPSIQGQWQVRKTNATLTAKTLTSTGANTILGASDVPELFIKGFSGQTSNELEVQRGDGFQTLWTFNGAVYAGYALAVGTLSPGGLSVHGPLTIDGDINFFNTGHAMSPDSAGGVDIGSAALPFGNTVTNSVVVPWVDAASATAKNGFIIQHSGTYTLPAISAATNGRIVRYLNITGAPVLLSSTDVILLPYGAGGTNSFTLGQGESMTLQAIYGDGALGITAWAVVVNQSTAVALGTSTQRFPALYTNNVNFGTGGQTYTSGANRRIGSGTLVAGVLVVANTSVTSHSHVMLQRTGNNSSVLGVLTVFSQTAGVGFTVKSLTAIDAVAVDTSTFDYVIYEDQ